MGKKFVSISACIGITAGLILASFPAQAAEVGATTPASETQVSKMEVVGYDREVAAANGYEVRVDSHGAEYSVPIGTPDAGPGQISTYGTGTADGDCGWSYVTLTSSQVNSQPDKMRSGYVVDGAVAFGKWGVTVVFPGGVTRDHNMDHGANAGSWSGSRDLPALTGYTRATVNNLSSAFMADGRVCVSGNPTIRDYM